MQELWSKDKEVEFFNEASKFASDEQLSYLGDDNKYYAYWPKSYRGRTRTLQARNSLIGNFTEKYSVKLLQDFAESKGWHAVQSVICEDIGLTNLSPADFAFCKTKNEIKKLMIYLLFLK